MKNLAIMNARLRRKRAASAVEATEAIVESEQTNATAVAVATTANAAAPKKKVKRVPQVINKTRLQENAAAAKAAGRRVSTRNRAASCGQRESAAAEEASAIYD